MKNIDSIQCEYKENIRSLTLEQRCLVWCDLNCWEWNSLLGEKPDNWDSSFIHVRIGNTPLKREIILPIMKSIEAITKEKDLDRYWNCFYNNHYTLEEFNKKFNGTHYLIKKIICVFNAFGLYTFNQKKQIQIIKEIAEKGKEEEMRKMYGR